jgi:Carboxypeptidase regulatory-like domain
MLRAELQKDLRHGVVDLALKKDVPQCRSRLRRNFHPHPSRRYHAARRSTELSALPPTVSSMEDPSDNRRSRMPYPDDGSVLLTRGDQSHRLRWWAWTLSIDWTGQGGRTTLQLHSRMLRSIVAVALTLCTAGCEAGLTVPKDPGTVHGRVRDQTGAPVANVPFSVESPNSNGSISSTFWETINTRSDGTVTMEGVPAGTHRTWVTPPAGYAAIPDSLTKYVSVSKGQTTEVTFTLTKP